MFVGIYLGSAAGLIPSLILTWLLGIFCLRLSRPLTDTVTTLCTLRLHTNLMATVRDVEQVSAYRRCNF